jgi:hypothetical protein
MGFDFRMLHKPKTLPPDYTPRNKNAPDRYQLSGYGMRLVIDAMKICHLLDVDATNPDATSGGSETVPIYKFTSNDGWKVTPRECELIVNGLRPLSSMKDEDVPKGGAELIETIREWVAFNDAASKNGGYCVN